MSARALLRSALRLPLRFVPIGTVMPVLSGPLRGARWVVGAGTNGCWLGTYEPLTRNWIRSLLQPGDVVFDIGANVGYFTLLCSRIVGQLGQVVAFEPLPANVVGLQRHIDLNDAGNVSLVASAISDRIGTARFEPAGNPAMGTLAMRGAIEVAVTTVDEVVSGGAVRRPNLLKIDVEGAELQVLLGGMRCLEEAGPAIVLSAHGWRMFEECGALLRHVGYDVLVAKDGSLDGDYLLIARACPR